MMVGVLLYAYCQGTRSSRRIARALERDVGFRVVAGNQRPDFRTLCRFRAQHERALEQLFVQVLRLCREAGLVKLGVVALDGTKVAANASLAADRGYEALDAEARKMLAEAKAVDEAEDAQYGPDRRGDELPEGLGRRADRLQRLLKAKARLEEEAAQIGHQAPVDVHLGLHVVRPYATNVAEARAPLLRVGMTTAPPTVLSGGSTPL